MRKCVVFAATLLLFVMVSCHQDYLNPTEAPTIWNVDTRAEKNPLDEIDFSALDTAYFVSDKDVEAYIHFKQLLAEGQGKDFEVLEIVPMGLNDEATLAYLLNYNEGWEIIAADKRAPTVLASDETGRFSVEEAPKNVMAWAEALEYDILFIRTFNGRPEGMNEETWERMLNNVDFWKAVNADKDFIYRSMGGTRYVPDEFLDGHWELISTTVEYDVLMETGHLTNTTWGAGDSLSIDYNMYCPNKQYSSGKAHASCAAVAGAQMAYYLHFKTGKPISSPSSIYCTATVGNVDYGTNMYIVGSTSTLWPVMSLSSPSTAVAKLIAGIDIQTEAVFGNDVTGYHSGYLKSHYFDSVNVACSFSPTYDMNVVKGSLINEMPVIVEAKLSSGIFNYLAMIIDKYRAYATQYTYTYEWVYDFPNNGGPQSIIDRVVIEYSNPDIIDFGMNWGWKGAFNNSNWYSPVGYWYVNGLYFDSCTYFHMYTFQ